MKELLYRAFDYLTGASIPHYVEDLEELRGILDGLDDDASVHIVHSEDGESTPFSGRDLSDVNALLDNSYEDVPDPDIYYREYAHYGEIYIDIEAPAEALETHISIRDF